MPKKPKGPPSDFWKRLDETYGRHHPMGQTEVARAFGKRGQSTSQRWYNGSALPESETLMQMAERGNTTMDYLVSGRLPKFRVRRGGTLDKLLQLWESLSDDGQRQVLEFAEDKSAREARSSRAEQKSPPAILNPHSR